MPSDWDSTYATTAQLAGQMYNAASAANTNKKQREWTEKMYGIQRADALADWHMQNDYNSPAAAMRRFTEAGLNKHLIYGGANQNGPVVRNVDAKSWNPTPPQVDLRGAADSFLRSTDLEMRQAQTDNIKAQNQNIHLDSLLKNGQLQLLGTQNEQSEFNLQQAKNLGQTAIEQATLNTLETRAKIAASNANTQFTLDENERKALSNAQSLQQGVQILGNLRAQGAQTAAQTAQIKQQTANLLQDNRIKQLDEKLAAQGIQPGGTVWNKVLNHIMVNGTTHQKIANLFNSLDKWLPDFLKVNAK